MDGRNFIDGRFVAPVAGRTRDVVCPSDGTVFARIAQSDATDVDHAVRSARAAFDTGPWPRMEPKERGRVLARMAALILREHEALAQLDARDVGKLVMSTRFDVTILARYFEYYSGIVDKFGGDQIPLESGLTALTFREPLGVVAGIIPWNSPTQMFGRVCSPALAMGNTVVLKPAEDACLAVLRLAELALEAGIPPGALNVVTGDGPVTGGALTCHPMLDFISFTGSPQTATLVQRAAAEHHVGVTLELGGKSPHIVFADADLGKAVPIITNSIIVNSGQTCVAGSRLLVQESRLEEVAAAFARHFEMIVAGSHESDADLGPLITLKACNRVNGIIEQAKADGIPVIAQGALDKNRPEFGYYVVPHLFGPVPRDHLLARDEVFGPVLSLLTFKDEEDAIALAEDTNFGLAAAVWTQDVGRAFRVARKIRAGQVYVNGYGAGGGVELPFGGFKKSGFGREKGLEALHEFSATKTVIFSHG